VDSAKWKILADETVNAVRPHVERALAPVREHLQAVNGAAEAKAAELEARIVELQARVADLELLIVELQEQQSARRAA
jgi:TolA-binding protein